MTIRWRRGFFRVWILLAILWLVLVGTVGSLSYDSAGAGGLYAFIEGRGDTAWSYDSPAFEAARGLRANRLMQEVRFKQSQVVLYVKAPIGEDFDALVGHYAPLAAGFYEMKVAESRGWIVLYCVIWAVAVPLTVLMIGWGIAWALSGFRERSGGCERDDVGAFREAGLQGPERSVPPTGGSPNKHRCYSKEHQDQ